MSREKLIHVQPAENLRFRPEKWNGSEVIKLRNCFAYVLDAPEVGFPGWHEAKNLNREDQYYVQTTIRAWQESCKNIVSRKNLSSLFARGCLEGAGFESISEATAHSTETLQDHIFAYLPAFEHFVRRDHSGLWSHKRGPLTAVDTDDRGSAISNLFDAKWRHSDESYWNWNFTEKPFDRYVTFSEIKRPDRCIQYYRVPQSGVHVEYTEPSGW